MVLKELEQKYNAKIEFTEAPYENYWENFTAASLAGDTTADIIRWWVPEVIPNAINKQLVIPIDDYTDIADISQMMPENILPLVGYEGKTYGLIQDGNVDTGVIYYNRELFTKLNLPDPHELVKTKMWTWDKFEEYMKAGTKDSDGDGKIDIYGFSSFYPYNAFIASNGVTSVDLDKGKQTLDDPKMLKALEWITKERDLKLTYEDSTGKKDGDEIKQAFLDGKIAMYQGPTWMMEDMAVIATKNKMTMGIMPYPIGPSGEYINYLDNFHEFFLAKNTKYPKEVLDIWKNIYSVKPAVVDEFPGQASYENVFKEQADQDTARLIHSGNLYDRWRSIPNYPYDKLLDDIYANKVPPATAIAKYTQEAQAAVDKLLKK
ncbi:unnamed protein product [Aphanomyces euteiches]